MENFWWVTKNQSVSLVQWKSPKVPRVRKSDIVIAWATEQLQLSGKEIKCTSQEHVKCSFKNASYDADWEYSKVQARKYKNTDTLSYVFEHP